MKKITLLLGMFFLVFGNYASYGQGVWNPQINPTTKSGESMQFVNPNEGWISLMESNSLLHTVDGGDTWTLVTPEPNQPSVGIDAPGSRLSFISSSTGWVLKSNAALGVFLYKTSNGGATWDKKVLSTDAGDSGIQVQFTDVNHGWVIIFNMTTFNAKFLKTTDGGDNWTPSNGRGIFQYLNNSIGYAFSAAPDMQPPYTVYKTTDGGVNWIESYIDNTPGEITAMYFSDENNGWFVGRNGKIFKTTNGGTNWTAVTSEIITSNNENNEVFFIDANNGWIASRISSGNGDQNLILYTNNGGVTWSQQTSNLFNYKIFCMSFTSNTNGWVAVDGGNIAHYTASLGVNDNFSDSKKVAFYPNPSDGHFNFYIKEPKAKLNIRIFNIVGQKVFETTNTDMKNENNIPFQPSAKGLYLIKVFDGEKEYNEKIIVK